MQKTREDKYSLLKGILIYCVICTHTMVGLGYATAGEYSSAMMALLGRIVGLGVPFFLLLSGFFISKKFKNSLNFDNGTFKAFFKVTILRRALIPYYIFTTAYMLKRAILGQKITFSNYFLLESQAHGLYYLVVFIYGLFFFLLTGWVLYHVFSLDTRESLIIIPTLSLIFFPITNFLMQHLNGNIILKSLPLISFFCFGILLEFVHERYQNDDKTNKLCEVVKYVIIVVLLIGTLWVTRKHFGHFPIIDTFPHTVWYLTFSSLLFIIVLLFIDVIKNFKYLTALGFKSAGERSLFVYGMHPFLLVLFINMSEILNYFAIRGVVEVLILAYLNMIISFTIFKLLPRKVRAWF